MAAETGSENTRGRDRGQQSSANVEKPNRYMPSIFPECDKLKQVSDVGCCPYPDVIVSESEVQVYDKCFTRFFQQYIQPDYRHQHASNPCVREHNLYRQCVDSVGRGSIFLPIVKIPISESDGQPTLRDRSGRVEEAGVVHPERPLPSQRPPGGREEVIGQGHSARTGE